MHHKPHLPQKPCLVCGRPFAWRKKWARDWNAVKYWVFRSNVTGDSGRT